jgi:Scaffold protein Nfu/NifU N terminal
VDDAARDAGRRELAARGLTPAAVAHLTRDALGRIDLNHLAPVKGLLKQFFSDAPWTTDDDDAFAALVGPGQGWWHHELDEGFDLDFGWRQGRFRLEVARTALATSQSDEARTRVTPRRLDETFEGAIVPEATPNPRTIRFVTGPIHSGPSRWYESAGQADDPRVARLFEEFDDVANVLVGPDFVAVGVRRADRWEELLGPMLRVLEGEFPAESQAAYDADGSDDVVDQPSIDVRATSAHRAGRAFDRAWRELRALKLDDDDGDVELLLLAVSSQEIATRQAAARVLLDADPDVARRAWSDLLVDPSPTVRRATVDAMVDAARPALRSLFERALADRDAWTRWKALRGLVDLGIEPSRSAVTPLATDTDFRVRLEAAGALRRRDRG